MDFIQCEKPPTAAYCTDNDCNCTLTPIENEKGFIYVSPEVVEFRKDALTLAAVQAKIDELSKNGEYISVTKYSPILICEEAAKKRNLDLAAASEDAILWWTTNLVPLRPTPLAKSDTEINEQQIQVDQPPQPILPEPEPVKLPVEETVKPAPEFQAYDGMESAQYVPKPKSMDDPPPTPLIAGTMVMNKNDFQALKKSLTTKPTPPAQPSIQKETVPPPPKSSLQSTKDISVDDVVAQYSSGPLAEMAKKMASDVGQNNNSKVPQEDDPNKTIIANFKRQPYSKQQDETIASGKVSKSVNATQVYSRKDMPKRAEAPDRMRLVLIIGIPALVLILSITIILTIVLSGKPAPVPVSKSSSDITDFIVLERAFFINSYSFEDDSYDGTISFSEINGISGKYAQESRSKLKNKMLKTSGNFSYSPQRITFRPNGSKKEIAWILDAIDTTVGTATFHNAVLDDNGQEIKIYLRKNF